MKVTDMIVSYIMKGGVVLETKGDFETEIDIPVVHENGTTTNIGIRIKCRDLVIKTIKE